MLGDMPDNNKSASYSRAPETRNKTLPYEEKFANLITLCETVKREGVDEVIVAWPWVLGDTYEEVIESLSRIADAGLALHIIKRGDNEHRSIPGVTAN